MPHKLVLQQQGKSMPSKTHPKIIAAAVQAAPVLMDLDGTIDKTIGLMKQAADQGAKLVAFPKPGFQAIPGGYGSPAQQWECSMFSAISIIQWK